MVKMIGILLIVSSLLSLVAGAYISSRYSGSAEITGNVVSNIINQSEVKSGFADYIAGAALSYSIISLMMGVMFLFRV